MSSTFHSPLHFFSFLLPHWEGPSWRIVVPALTVMIVWNGVSFAGNVSVDDAPRFDGVVMLGLATNVILRGLPCCFRGFSVGWIGVSATDKGGAAVSDANGLCDAVNFFERDRGLDMEVVRWTGFGGGDQKTSFEGTGREEEKTSFGISSPKMLASLANFLRISSSVRALRGAGGVVTVVSILKEDRAILSKFLCISSSVRTLGGAGSVVMVVSILKEDAEGGSLGFSTGGISVFIVQVGGTGRERSWSRKGCARLCGPSLFIGFILSPALTFADFPDPELLFPLTTRLLLGDKVEDDDGEGEGRWDSTFDSAEPQWDPIEPVDDVQKSKTWHFLRVALVRGDITAGAGEMISAVLVRSRNRVSNFWVGPSRWYDCWSGASLIGVEKSWTWKVGDMGAISGLQKKERVWVIIRQEDAHSAIQKFKSQRVRRVEERTWSWREG